MRAVTEAHARAMDQLAVDLAANLAAPNPMFTALQELPERRRGMFDMERGVRERRIGPGGEALTSYAYLLDDEVTVDLTPWDGRIPSPIEFMEWAQRVSGINHVAELPITHAVVGGPPDDWHRLRIIDEDTGERTEGVHEINVQEGWFTRYRQDEDGTAVLNADGAPEYERVEGRFRIERMGSHEEPPSGERLRKQMRARLIGEAFNFVGIPVTHVLAVLRALTEMPECFLVPGLSLGRDGEDAFALLRWPVLTDGAVALWFDDLLNYTLRTPHGSKDVPAGNPWVELAEALGMTLGSADLPAVARRQAPTGKRLLDLGLE